MSHITSTLNARAARSRAHAHAQSYATAHHGHGQGGHGRARPAHHAPKAKQPRNEFALLIALCAFAFMGLGVVLMLKWLPASDYQFGKFMYTYLTPRDEQSLTLGQVKLGTTIDHVRDRYQNAVKGVTRDGAITMAFLDGGDQYMVWYGEDGPQHVAYKARQSREMTGITEDQLVGALAERYGAPSVSSCSKRIVDGVRDCQFSWWIPGDVRLDINSRQTTTEAGTQLKVTTQITDSLTAGRLRRNQERSDAASYY